MTVNEHIKYWDEMYQTKQYFYKWHYKYASQELISFIATGLVPSNGNCLDMGCGSGNEAIFLSKLGYNVTGIDFSEKAIKIARERAKIQKANTLFINAIVTNTGLPSNSFDFVNDRGCFHHIAESERKLYANEIYRILKPGGRFLLRGSRNSNIKGFIDITNIAIEKNFNKNFFFRGHILPITLIYDTGKLESNLVVLTKRDLELTNSFERN